jgi:ubiquinone biosynthesis monooxygenase Coq7
MPNSSRNNPKGIDIKVIRSKVRLSDLKFRGTEMKPKRLRKIRRGLRTLHTLETMAANIYKYQISRRESELNLQLIAAMSNEMTHLQDFQSRIFEYGFKPNKLRFVYWIVGWILGFLSRLRGRKAILKTGIWVETKAVHHYEELLKDIDWDKETRKIIEKDQADEFGHIQRWKSFLK